jgi:hypothetical protein
VDWIRTDFLGNVIKVPKAWRTVTSVSTVLANACSLAPQAFRGAKSPEPVLGSQSLTGGLEQGAVLISLEFKGPALSVFCLDFLIGLAGMPQL